MWAIVPLKSPPAAKSRLSEVLDARARERWFYALAEHVLATLSASPCIERVVVATASEPAAQFARRMQAEVLHLPQDEGTAHACRAALERLLAPGFTSVLMIAADLPLLDADALAQLAAVANAERSVGIAPDRRRHGTNALVCTPPELIAAQFGEHSFERHVAAARACGAALHIIESQALALDIDAAGDLRVLRTLAESGTQSLSPALRELLAPQEALAT